MTNYTAAVIAELAARSRPKIFNIDKSDGWRC